MTEIVLRWSGTGLVLGAALLGTASVTVALTPVMNQPLSQGASRLLMLSSMLLLLALPAMYTRQTLPAGWLCLVGHGLLQTGLLLLVVLAATAGFFFVFLVAEYLPPVTGQIGSALFSLLLALALAGIGIAPWTVKLGAAI